MSLSVTIRTALPTDAAAIVALIRKLAAFESPGTAIRLTENGLLAHVFGPHPVCTILVAEKTNAVIGLANLLPIFSSWQDAPALLLHDLYVEENARGEGVGHALLVAAAQLAKQRGCCRLDVNVLADNAPARQFYESLGFSALPEWVIHRLDGDRLARLVDSPPPHSTL